MLSCVRCFNFFEYHRDRAHGTSRRSATEITNQVSCVVRLARQGRAGTRVCWHAIEGRREDFPVRPFDSGSERSVDVLRDYESKRVRFEPHIARNGSAEALKQQHDIVYRIPGCMMRRIYDRCDDASVERSVNVPCGHRPRTCWVVLRRTCETTKRAR